jgi:hypothetical protein
MSFSLSWLGGNLCKWTDVWGPPVPSELSQVHLPFHNDSPSPPLPFLNEARLPSLIFTRRHEALSRQIELTSRQRTHPMQPKYPDPSLIIGTPPKQLPPLSRRAPSDDAISVMMI